MTDLLRRVREVAGVVLSGEVVGSSVGDLVNSSTHLSDHPDFQEQPESVIDVLPAEVDSLIAGKHCGRHFSFRFENFKDTIISKNHPVSRIANEHCSIVNGGGLVGYSMFKYVVNRSLTVLQGITISDSGVTMWTRTTRGPMSGSNMNRNGLVLEHQPAMVLRNRTMLYNTAATQKRIEAQARGFTQGAAA